MKSQVVNFYENSSIYRNNLVLNRNKYYEAIINSGKYESYACKATLLRLEIWGENDIGFNMTVCRGKT